MKVINTVLVTITLAVVVAAVLLGKGQVKRIHQQMESIRLETTKAQEQIDRVQRRQLDIEAAQEAHALEVFPEPAMAAMEIGFRQGRLKEAMSIAENMLLAYPADAAGYRRFVHTFETAVGQSLQERDYVNALRLTQWHGELQRVQVRVLKGKPYLDSFLEARSRNADLQNEGLAVAQAHLYQVVPRIRTTPGEVAGGKPGDELEGKLSQLLILATSLGAPPVVDVEKALTNLWALREVEFLPKADSEDVEHIVDLSSLCNERELFGEVKRFLKDRLGELASRYAAETRQHLDALRQDEAEQWLEAHLAEMLLVDSATNEHQLAEGQQVTALVQKAQAMLLTIAMQELTQRCKAYVEGKSSVEELLAAQQEIHVKLVESGVPAIEVQRLIQVVQEAIERREDQKVLARIESVRSRLNKAALPKSELEMLLDEMLTVSPSDGEGARLYRVTVSALRTRLHEREREEVEAKRRAYLTWAFGNLKALDQRLENAPRRERLSERVSVLKEMREIDENLLNWALSNYCHEIRQKAMEGLDEPQKLEVYEHWVQHDPRGLDDFAR